MADADVQGSPAAAGLAELGLAWHTTRLDAQHPWPGLAPYDEGASGLFKGRARETAELARLVRLAPLTVLYGKSGLGKSSLLQAGLFPLLRSERYLPVLVTIDFGAAAEATPLEQIARRLDQAIAEARADAPARRTGEPPWNYLHRRDLEIWSPDNHLLTPVLVFDQFEALFAQTGDDAGRVEAVFDALADLAENRIPQQVAADRERRAALDLLVQRYRMVIAFREDYLPEMRAWELRLPTLLRNYLRLEPMSREQALAAVAEAGEAVLAEGAAGRIVDFVAAIDAGGRRARPVVEPVLLSLCCYQLNLRRPPGERIDAELIDTAGSDILEGFYQEALAGMPEGVAAFIETHLIQGDRSRGSYARDEALHQGFLTRAQLDELTNRHRLLRVEDQGDTVRIELIHDRLVEVVRKSRGLRDARRRLAEQQRLRQEAEQAAQRERAQRESAEADRTRLRRLQRGLAVLLVVLFVLTTAAIWSAQRAERSESRFKAFSLEATALRLVAEAQAMLGGVRTEGDERALLQLLVAQRLAPGPATDGGLLDGLVERAALLKLIPVDTPVLAVAISPDGQRIVSGGEDGLRLWDAASGEPLGPKGRVEVGIVRSVAFSPDGTRIVSGGEDRAVRLWDGRSGEPAGDALTGHEDRVDAVAFSPDGQLIASGSGKGSVLLWDVRAGGAQLRSIRVGVVAITSLAFSPDGRRLAVGTGIGTLQLWGVAGSAPEGPKFAEQQEAVLAVAFSPDGERLASASADRTLLVRDVATGRELVRIGDPLAGTNGPITSVVWASSGLALVAGCGDGRLRVWDSRDGRLLDTLPGHRLPISGVASSADGERIVSSGRDGLLKVWTGHADRRFGRELGSDASEARIVAIGPPPRRWAVAVDHSRLVFWDVGQPAALSGARQKLYANRRLTSVAFSPDGSLLATGAEDGSLQWWDPIAMKPVGRAVPAHATALRRVVFSPDGRLVATGGDDGRLRLWHTADGGPAGLAVQTEGGRVTGLAFSPDGAYLVSGGDDGLLRAWTVAGGRPVGAPVDAHRGGVSALAFSPDGRRVATGGPDKRVRLWDARRMDALTALNLPRGGHEAGVLSVAFSPDGRRLVSGSWDGDLRFWDVATGAPIGKPLTSHPGAGESLAFSPDGQSVVSSGANGLPRLWPAPDSWPAALCAKVTRNPGREQWREWVAPDIEFGVPCPGLPVWPEDTTAPPR